jgi:hypothetical protein
VYVHNLLFSRQTLTFCYQGRGIIVFRWFSVCISDYLFISFGLPTNHLRLSESNARQPLGFYLNDGSLYIRWAMVTTNDRRGRYRSSGRRCPFQQVLYRIYLATRMHALVRHISRLSFFLPEAPGTEEVLDVMASGSHSNGKCPSPTF